MSSGKLRSRLRATADPILGARGFQNTRGLEYFRLKGTDRKERIGLSTFVDRTGTIRATLGIGIRFETVERLRRRELDPEAPTIGIPLHFLRPGRKYFDWPLRSEQDWIDLETEIARGTDDAEQFLALFPSLTEVAAALESDDPRNWFTLGPTVRTETLALIDFSRGGREAAITRLGHAIASLEDAPAKERVPLIRLRDHLASLAPDSR